MTAARELSRRAVLGGAVVLAAGCSLGGDDDGPAGPPPPHPDVVLADEAAARERRLLAAYDAALVLAPQLADRLAGLRAEHAEHLVALGVPGAGPTPAATATATPPPPAAALPADPPALLAALADLERSAAGAHAGAAVRAGRGLAVVLASAAASEASHVVALG